MSFFSPRPQPDPAETHEAFYAHPWQEPENVLAGLGAPGITLLRDDTTAVQLALTGAYPQGLALALRARAHPDHPIRLWIGPPMPSEADDMRFGIEWPDGRRVEDNVGWQPGQHTGPDAFTLMPGGGGGGGLVYEWRYWLWPLPPPGPATVHFEWQQRGIPETGLQVDLAPFVDAARNATPLWPLPERPDADTHATYGPLTGGVPFSFLFVGDPDKA